MDACGVYWHFSDYDLLAVTSKVVALMENSLVQRGTRRNVSEAGNL